MSVNKVKLVKSIQERGQYFIGPNEIWQLPLSLKAKTAYIYLIGQSESWNPGLKGIAEALSISINTARSAINELEKSNMILIEEGPNGFRNVYTINGLTEWNFQAQADFDVARGTQADSAWGTQAEVARTQEEGKAGRQASLPLKQQEENPLEAFAHILSPELREELGL